MLGGLALMVGMIDSILRSFLTTSGKLGSSKILRSRSIPESRLSVFLADKMVMVNDKYQSFLYDPPKKNLDFNLIAKVIWLRYEDTKKNMRLKN